MIIEYHRPDNLKAALALLAKAAPATYPLGGGTVINRSGQDDYAVVDLQALGLDQIEPEGNWLKIGATVKLETLAGYAGLPTALARAIRLELPVNLRHSATAAASLWLRMGALLMQPPCWPWMRGCCGNPAMLM